MNPIKVFRIAVREFVSTALTKGFIIGALVVPAVLLTIMPLVVMLAESAKPPAVVGEVAVIDRTGVVAGLLEGRLAPEEIAARQRERLAAAMNMIADVLPEGVADAAGIDLTQLEPTAQSRVYEEMGVPQLRLTLHGPETDEETLQQRIRDQLGVKTARGADRGLLAVAVVDGTAVEPAEDETEFGGYRLLTVPKLDDRTIVEIEGALEWAILERRYEAAGLDRDELDRLSWVASGDVQEVTETGTRKSSLELNMLLPAIPMLLILVGVFTGGQYLLTTTIEEKSSRVVEVLLSSVSAMELMTGKIVGAARRRAQPARDLQLAGLRGPDRVPETRPRGGEHDLVHAAVLLPRLLHVRVAARRDRGGGERPPRGPEPGDAGDDAGDGAVLLVLAGLA